MAETSSSTDTVSSEEESTVSPWIKLSDLQTFQKLFKQSNTTLLVASPSKIMTYDSISDDWTESPMIFPVYESDTEAFDAKTDTFYTLDREYVRIFPKTNPAQKKQYLHNIGNFGITPVSVYIDDKYGRKYHIIGGFRNKYHSVFDVDTKTCVHIHQFKELEVGNSGPGLVHVKSRDELLLFGGFDDKRGKDGWLDDIWRYSLNDNVWELLQVKLPIHACDFPYLLTNDDQYLIVYLNEKFYYWRLDGDELVFKESVVEIPFSGHIYWMVLMGDAKQDGLCVDGWIRNCDEFEVLDIPDEIVMMIKRWYISEYIHILDPYGAKEHWKINVNEVILDY